MSQPLQDLRAKITTEAHAVLVAEQRATGRDQSEIVRDVLHEWALQRINAANVLHRQLLAEGMTGIGQGAAGNAGEREGTRGKRS